MFSIKTKRFLIKKLTLRNVNKTYFSWFKDSIANKYIVASDSVIKGGIKYLKLYVRKKINKKNILFLAIFTKKNSHIGNIKFEPISIKTNTAIAGILIGNQKWRRKGVLKEIFPPISEFLYKYYGILRIELGAANNNKIAIISYKKIGFKDLKSKDAVLIKKKKNNNIYSYNILRQFIKK
jgi:ribosomal-protein-alanine N-acetyltransferase